MKLGGWQVEGFGALRDARVDGLSGGVNLFHGPNEAGKSTLLAYLRFMLFGFRRGNSREPRYPPAAGTPHGGRLWLDPGLREGATKWTIERHCPASGRAQRLRIRDESGHEIDPSRLASALGHADRDLYAGVFAFSLSELQSLDSLSAKGIQEHIFSAGITGAGRSAQDALRRIEREATELFKGRTRGRIRVLADELAGIDSERIACLESIRAHPKLAREESELASQLALMRDESTCAREAEMRTGKLISLWHDLWSPLEERREQLEKLENVGESSLAAGPKLAECTAAIPHAQAEVDRLDRSIDALTRELEALGSDRGPARDTDRNFGPDEPLLESRHEIGALERERALHEAQLRDWPSTARALDEAEGRLSEALGNLGGDWSVDRLRDFDASLPRCEEAVTRGDALLASLREREAFESRRENLELEFRRLERRRDAERSASELEVPESSEVLAVVREGLARLRSIGLEIEAIEGRLRARTELASLHAASSAGGLAIFAAVILMLSAAAPWLALERGILDERLQGPVLGLTAAVAAVAATGSCVALASLYLGLRRRRARARCIAEEERQLDELEEARTALEDEHETLSRAFDVSTEAEALHAAEQRLERAVEHRRRWEARHEALQRLEAEWNERGEELDLHEQRCQSALARQHESEEEWLAWKRSVGIPDGVTPASLRLFFQSIQRAREILEGCDHARDRAYALQESIHAFEQRISALLAHCCHAAVDLASPERSTRLLVALDELAERCRRAQEVARQREELTRQLEALRVEAGQATAACERAQADLESLLRSLGARDCEDLARRIEIAERRSALQAEIESAERALERRMGRDEEASALRAELAAGRVGEWEREHAESREALRVAEERRDEVLRRHQDLRGEISRLEESNPIGELALRRSALEEELAGSVARWRELQIARALIERTLARFEGERQPDVLREASHLFARVTEGRYRAIVQSAELGGFSVVDVDGVRRLPGELSRGTAEQLYICVRLGLIAEFARRARSLPVVMDDVFVNFDDARAAAMAQVIADFAHRAGVQVLVFSCSARTRADFEAAVPGLTTSILEGPAAQA